LRKFGHDGELSRRLTIERSTGLRRRSQTCARDQSWIRIEKMVVDSTSERRPTGPTGAATSGRATSCSEKLALKLFCKKHLGGKYLQAVYIVKKEKL
jgi:hypothetical protein